MKTIKVTTDNKLSIIDVDFNNFRSLQQAIGGHFETVHTRRMQGYFEGPVLMIVDEEGLIKGLPLNILGSWFYATEEHGHPIVGDFILAVRDSEDLLGLEDPEEIKRCLLHDFRFLEEDNG